MVNGGDSESEGDYPEILNRSQEEEKKENFHSRSLEKKHSAPLVIPAYKQNNMQNQIEEEEEEK